MFCSYVRMRHLLLALLVAGTAFSMLRSGYSSEAVQRELSVRRCAESCDVAAEKALTDLGAAPALIDTHLAVTIPSLRSKIARPVAAGNFPHENKIPTSIRLH